MKFINYTNDGRVVVQHAALILSKLDETDTLELHTMDNAIILLKKDMYYSATESGPIDTMPDIPGLAVWHDGHIGVYIGGGQVIEAMGTKYGVVKTELAGRGWTHWLKIPYINYD